MPAQIEPTFPTQAGQAATVAQRLLDLAKQAPEKVILRLLFNQAPDQPITYAELLQRSNGYAQALAGAGIQPGEVVILILQHGADLAYAFFGAILHGAIPSIMPFLTEKLSPEQYRRSLAALFEICAPAAVITYPEFESEVRQAISPHASIRTLLLSSQIAWPAEAAEITPTKGIQPADIVLLQHSSGTTGLQKGVALSHQAVFNQLESYSRALHLAPADVIVSWLPLYHDMGLIAGFLLPILSSIPLVLLSPFDWVRAPYRMLQAISQYQGTLAWLPNFAYNFCAQKIRPRDLEGVDLSSWRAVINCSEPMYYRSHQLFLERFAPYGFRASALATCYAMAENVFAVTQGGIDAPVTIDPVSQRGLLIDRLARPPQPGEDVISMLSVGRPIDNTRVRILDEHHHDLAERSLGEIALHSDCMLTGYYKRPDLTKKAFAGGWYLTGDLGYMADGEVYVTGRKKDLIIVGGKNVYPQDLEGLASEVAGIHPGRVAAFGVPNPDTGTEDVVIAAELEDQNLDPEDPAAQAIADEIRQRVTRGSDVVLRYVKLVRRGWLLKTSSGKVARSANREKYLSESDNFSL
ncbi:MAG TPA: fatty acyl-AMP ligase [Anaerolineales bacterium]|nr:fatty acyl-AMP ligase [Anaerolineales bacterium]